MTFCFSESDRMIIPEGVSEALTRLKELNKSPPAGFDKSDIFLLRKHLETFTTVPVYGYNSSRYDLAIIFDRIVMVADRLGLSRYDISILKKTNAYFSVNIKNLYLKDLSNFTTRMPLDKYLRLWTENSVKLVYPYEKFGSIEEIRSQTVFPEVDEFTSMLKGRVDVDLYHECKNEYDRRCNLPSGHPQKWSTFEDYLKHYNLSDVKPASQGLIKQFETYLQNFGCYPNHYLGLPSFAKAVMFSQYNESSPSIFSFPENSDATNVFRSNMIGGLTNVYKRHVTLDVDEEAASAAKYSKRGRPWKKIEFYDINSMYPSCFGSKFPTGLGYEWTLGFRNRLKKKLMTNKKVSMESIEWLDYMSQEKLKIMIVV